ncbi:MAG: helix-turn-helix domain-containing protein [Cyanobacteria bacterium RM1_2_2]|nr:helix-turn-helix domain-containing protein [Cyanobacteria bacterium RM1_2_2]
MTRPRPLSDRDLALIHLYANCQLGLSPRRFYAKWEVSHEAIAQICSRSPSTVRRWFGKGKHYRTPSLDDLRHLALMDFLLEHYDEIPLNLFDRLCGSPQRIQPQNPNSPST